MTSAAASLLALGDANRLVLLRLLLDGPLTVGDLTTVTGLGQSLVSHHLAVLIACGWLAARREGRRRVYAPTSSARRWRRWRPGSAVKSRLPAPCPWSTAGPAASGGPAGRGGSRTGRCEAPRGGAT